jgi:ADP-heptose:LPS heptosyltransferase
MPQTMPDAPQRRLLVLFPGALGDFVCFLSALSALMEDSHVDLLARTEFADLAPPAVNVASLERYEIRRLFVAGAQDDERVRDFFASYAAVYSWMGSQAPEFVRQLESVSQGGARIFPFRPGDQKMHQRDYYLACLAPSTRAPALARGSCSGFRPTGVLEGAAGLPVGLHAPNRKPPLAAIAPRPQAVEWCDHFWREHSLGDRAILTLAPGSGAAEKNWPIHFYRAVAEWWRHSMQGAAVLLSGPVEEARGGFDVLSDCCETARNLDLAQVAALLARSDLYLGNDSGITHLAAAVGVRTVALFGPSDALEWAPPGKRVTVLSRNVECSPCEISVMKNCPHRKCLTAFYPTDVTRELEKLPEVAALTRWVAGIKV